MLRIKTPVPSLSAAEQFALDVLVDLSRVLVAEEGVDAVALEIVAGASVSTVDAAAHRSWCMRAIEGRIEVERPLLALIADVAGATAEQRSDAADQFGRVPPTVNTLVHHASEKDPAVNRMAYGLRLCATIAAEQAGKRFVALAPWPEGKRWAMAMTHDLDVVDLWPAYSAMRVVELAKHGDIGRAAAVVAGTLTGLLNNPVRRAAENILRVERELGIRSTWFVIAGTPTFATMRVGDITYAPESTMARTVMRMVGDAGHEIGLHGSFATFTFRDVFEAQRARLAVITGAPAIGARQHFLRMRPGKTHAAMGEAGFFYDSTYGFSERNGFRLGVADIIPVWDDKAQRVLSVDTAPFVWMDRALSKYRHVEDPEVWTLDALSVAKPCREMNGLWTGIWHPNMDASLGFPRAPEAFEKLCRNLMADSPWATNLGAAVSWRRARRTARAVGVTPNGDIRLRASDPRVALEGADESAIKHQPA
jgi:hypothetical protein